MDWNSMRVPFQEQREAPGNEEAKAEDSTRGNPILRVQPRKLRTDEELRRIFGSKFINSERRDADEGLHTLALEVICLSATSQ